MKTRCYNTKQPCYPTYGGRGITVCERWRTSFQSFLDDMGPATSEKHSIERIDPNGHYEPGNCRWATQIEQANNTRASRRITFAGTTLTIAQWERERGFQPGTLKRRLLLGWPVERAFTEPIRHW